MAAPSPDGPEATLRSCSTGLGASSSNTGTGWPQIRPYGTSTRSLRLGSSGVRGEEMLHHFWG